MKMMTCGDMGGPCETQMQASTAEEMMAKGVQHLQAMVAADPNDMGHKKALDMMQKMQANPDSDESKAWTADFKKKFDALPEMAM